MSDTANTILDELADGPKTIAQLAEDTGLEISTVAAILATLKREGRVYSGRGGWRVEEAAAPTVRRHEAAGEPAIAAPASERKAKKPNAKKKPAGAKRARGKKRTPAPAAILRAARAKAKPIAIAYPVDKDSRYIFGITELGELTITDRKNTAKTACLTAHDTTRLAKVLDQWSPLLQEQSSSQRAA